MRCENYLNRMEYSTLSLPSILSYEFSPCPLFQAKLSNYRVERLQKRERVDPRQADHALKKRIVDILEKAEESNRERLDKIAEAQIQLSNNFKILVQHLCQPRGPPVHYCAYTPTHSYTPPPMAQRPLFTPSPMPPHYYARHPCRVEPRGPAPLLQLCNEDDTSDRN